jgi:predicted transcriptional regulator
MKLLLYCTKAKPYLYHLPDGTYLLDNVDEGRFGDTLNGTIPCECDYDVEDIYYGYEIDDFWTKTCGSQKDIKHNLLKQSCLTDDEMHQYLQPKDSYYGDCGKAIHIKNLKIFDESKRLNEFTVYTRVNYTKEKRYTMQMLNKAPQNMCYVWDEHNIKYALISIHPEWLGKILSGEKKIEVRKKVLKEM